uniref:PMEI domain-containing protein n=1 Tax=Mesocestoides corti TaxID=53468 RepID=A0A5K3G2N5_MESCO
MKVEDTADPQSRNATLRDIKTCVDLIKACNSALNEIALTDHSCRDRWLQVKSTNTCLPQFNAT